jgi:GNAT superfamily N-acetyltransferase
METIVLRKAGSDDLEDLAEMRIAIQKHVEKSDPGVWRFSDEGFAAVRKEIRLRLESKACLIAIAETSSGIKVGMVMAEIVKNFGVIPELYGHIHWLYVKEPARRYGIGKRLIQFTTDFFAAWGIEFITVGFVVENPEAASFWPSVGFKPRVMHSFIKRDDLSCLNIKTQSNRKD